MAGLLSNAQLAYVRAIAAKGTCDTPAVIKRAPRTPNTGGGNTIGNYVQVSANGLLAGMKAPTASQLQNYGYLIGTKASSQINFPWGTDVLKGDLIEIDGWEFKVIDNLTPQSYATLETVLATKER